jgi:hypothetical protein
MSFAPPPLLLTFGCLFACGIACSAAAQDQAKPAEHVTGTGGTFLRYSSKQVSVDLTPAEQATFQQARDQRYDSAEPGAVLDAVAVALAQQGYAVTGIDRDFRLVEAHHDELLVSKRREVLRGVLKARLKAQLPGRPDHQSTEAMIAVKPDGQGVLVRSRFIATVWDSNGDARTRIVGDAKVYRDFYAAVGTRLR